MYLLQTYHGWNIHVVYKKNVSILKISPYFPVCWNLYNVTHGALLGKVLPEKHINYITLFYTCTYVLSVTVRYSGLVTTGHAAYTRKKYRVFLKKIINIAFKNVELLVKTSKYLLVPYNFHFADVFVIYTYFFNT